jgi:hypothetical protein
MAQYTGGNGHGDDLRLYSPACSYSIRVLNSNDSGAGSLRQALSEVCENGIITFADGLNGVSIDLSSGPLLIDKGLTIDASALSDTLLVVESTNSHVYIKNAISQDVALIHLKIVHAPSGSDISPSGYAIAPLEGSVTGKGTSGSGVADSNTKVLDPQYPSKEQPSDLLKPRGEIGLYPNPVSGPATFKFQVSENARVIIELSSMTGQRIATIFNQDVEGGITQTIVYPQTLQSGIYPYTMRWNNQLRQGKMVVIRQFLSGN